MPAYEVKAMRGAMSAATPPPGAGVSLAAASPEAAASPVVGSSAGARELSPPPHAASVRAAVNASIRGSRDRNGRTLGC